MAILFPPPTLGSKRWILSHEEPQMFCSKNNFPASLLYLSTHEDDVGIRPQPVHKDLHNLNEALIREDLQSLGESFLTVK